MDCRSSQWRCSKAAVCDRPLLVEPGRFAQYITVSDWKITDDRDRSESPEIRGTPISCLYSAAVKYGIKGASCCR